MVAGVWSEDRAAQLEATTHFRKLLSIGMEKVFPAELKNSLPLMWIV